MSEKNGLRFYLLLFLVGFAINFVWELSQMQYFNGKAGATFSQGVFYCSLATVIDGITIVSIYFVAGKIFKSNSLKFYLLAAILGALCAIVYENLAFFLELWSYRESMPIVPFINVGVLPFVQLSVLVPFSIFLTYNIFWRSRK